MDEEVDEGATHRARDDKAPDPVVVAPAAVLEGLPDAVVAAARDGRIVFVNAIAEELFGYKLGDSQADLSFDERDSAPFAPLAEVVAPAFDWDGDRPPRTKRPAGFQTGRLGHRDHDPRRAERRHRPGRELVSTAAARQRWVG